jgi:hypothetical protein
MRYASRIFELLGSHAENGCFRRHVNWLVMISLIFVIGIIYWPIFDAYFISDDYTFLLSLHSLATQLLNGQKWEEWFVGGIVQYSFFRPFGNLSWLLDFIIYGLAPIGYHITSVTLHVLASFEVFLLSYQLTSKRITAGMAALLFAVMPVHVEPISWTAARYDVLAGLFYFGGLVFFILHLRARSLRFYLISLGAFVFALSSKETALTFPAVILLYEVLFNLHGFAKVTELVKRHIPFWLIIGIRLVWFGHGYTGLHLAPEEGWWYWVDLNSLRVVDPFVSDPSHELAWALLGSAVILVLAYRLRREVVWSLMWIPLTLLPTIAGGVSDRSFYIPSFGLSLLLATLLTSLVARRTKMSQLLGMVALIALVVAYGLAVFSHNQAYYKAGEVAETIPLQVKTLHPTFPAGARLVFVGVPDQIPEGPLVYLTGFPGFLTLLYPNPEFRVFKFQKFPIWLDELAQTYFFEVNHRQVTERADLVRALQQRQQCQSALYPATEWDFTQDSQGWEPWNQLSDYAVRDGALTAKSDGNDPYIASPLIDIPSMAIGDIVITMRARSSKPEMHGKIYWLGIGQSDFSPALQMPFTIKADGEYHIYRVDISQSNQLLLGDHIERLRLNPADASAEIAVKEIQVYTHCSAVQGDQCICSP